MSGGAIGSSVTLEEVFAVVGTKRVPLAPELAGYLVLEVAEHADPNGGDVDPRSVFVGDEGTVALVKPRRDGATGRRRSIDPRGPRAPARGERLADAGARGREQAQERRQACHALAEELEAALIPVNRAAGRRALARLAREVKRVTLGVGRNATAARPASSRRTAAPPAPTLLRTPAATEPPAPPRPRRPARRQPELHAGGGADHGPRPDPRRGVEEGHARAASTRASCRRCSSSRPAGAVAVAGRRRRPHRATSASRAAASSSTPATSRRSPASSRRPLRRPRSSAGSRRAKSPSDGRGQRRRGAARDGRRRPAEAPAASPRPPAAAHAHARAAPRGLNERQLPTQPSKLKQMRASLPSIPTQKKSRRGLGVVLLLFVLAGRRASCAFAPRAGACGRTPRRSPRRRTRHRRVIARARCPCTDIIVVSDVPPHAEVLVRKGQAPGRRREDARRRAARVRGHGRGVRAQARGRPRGRQLGPGLRRQAAIRGRGAARQVAGRARDQRPMARRRAWKRGRRAGAAGHGARRGDAARRRGVDARGPRARRAHRAAARLHRGRRAAPAPGPTTYRKRLHVSAADFVPDETAGTPGGPPVGPEGAPAESPHVSGK